MRTASLFVPTASLDARGQPDVVRAHGHGANVRSVAGARAATRSLCTATRNAAGGTVGADSVRPGTDTQAQAPCHAARDVRNRTRNDFGEPLSPPGAARAADYASREGSQATNSACNEGLIGLSGKRTADSVPRTAHSVAADASQATRSVRKPRKRRAAPGRVRATPWSARSHRSHPGATPWTAWTSSLLTRATRSRVCAMPRERKTLRHCLETGRLSIATERMKMGKGRGCVTAHPLQGRTT